MGYGAYENLRVDYDKFTLLEDDINDNPISQFENWFKEAQESDIEEPNAMTLSTVSDNIPSARIVLLKGVSQKGFIFYTNYGSQKGNEIESNPNVALTFLWDKLQRQVRINGTIEKMSKSDSEQYFNQRPYKSKLGALASDQSKVAKNREEIEKRFAEFEEKYPENPPMPENWGGYLVKPSKIEFWQGRRSRMHDRLVYSLINNNWDVKRLYP
jgi:pyridoxamine 5'-phosphate oxidase